MSQLHTTQRIDYLDTLRGIAALMVLFGHFFLWKYEHHAIVNGLYFIFNAHDAVSFFFVLSGFVLSYSYLQNPTKPLYLNHFYLSRITRLLPAFWIALVGMVCYFNRYNLNLEQFKAIFIDNNNRFWEEFFLFKGYNNYFIPGWTLTVEICFSFLMPFIIVIAKYNRKVLLPMAVASLLASYIVGLFLFHFIIGCCIAAYFNELNSKDIAVSKWYRNKYWLWIIAILLFSLRPILHISPLGSTLNYILQYLHLNVFIFSGIAAALIIVLVFWSKRLQHLLRHPILLFYGKISYGIYLMHWMLVTAFYDYWEKWLVLSNNNIPLIMLLGAISIFIITTALATILYYTVEQPFIKIGKKWCNTIAPKLNINP
jgi:peptidoglycan/LPS O-acetylase OafA/YrhL